jgi:y4mF family transcriptional regulator
MSKIKNISDFIKQSRKRAKITQVELSKLSGVGIRFIKELESGKETVQVNKVNQVLKLFGAQLIPGRINNNEE